MLVQILMVPNFSCALYPPNGKLLRVVKDYAWLVERKCGGHEVIGGTTGVSTLHNSGVEYLFTVPL